MRIFRPEIEAVLKMLTVLMLVALIVLPVAWGYEQRRQARNWQNVACSYRVREIVLRAPIVSGVDRAGDPCAALRRLGFELDTVR